MKCVVGGKSKADIKENCVGDNYGKVQNVCKIFKSIQHNAKIYRCLYARFA